MSLATLSCDFWQNEHLRTTEFRILIRARPNTFFSLPVLEAVGRKCRRDLRRRDHRMAAPRMTARMTDSVVRLRVVESLDGVPGQQKIGGFAGLPETGI